MCSLIGPALSTYALKTTFLMEQLQYFLQVENDAMDILDYIDNRRSDSLALKHRILQKVSSPVLERQRILRVGDHLMRYKSVKPLEIESPDEPKLYPRHMY